MQANQTVKNMSHFIYFHSYHFNHWEYCELTIARSPVIGLVDLMDRVLCLVIAKVRVRFLVKPEIFQVLFQPPRLFISLWGSFPLSWHLLCFSLAAFMFEYQLRQSSMHHCLPVVLHQSFNHNFLRGLGIRNKALNYSSISRRVKCWMIHIWKKYIIIFTAVLLCILLVRNSVETL